MAWFSLYMQKGGLKPYLFHFTLNIPDTVIYDSPDIVIAGVMLSQNPSTSILLSNQDQRTI